MHRNLSHNCYGHWEHYVRKIIINKASFLRKTFRIIYLFLYFINGIEILKIYLSKILIKLKIKTFYYIILKVNNLKLLIMLNCAKSGCSLSLFKYPNAKEAKIGIPRLIWVNLHIFITSSTELQTALKGLLPGPRNSDKFHVKKIIKILANSRNI